MTRTVDQNQLRQLVRAKIERSGTTITAFAQECGIDHSTLSLFLSGKRAAPKNLCEHFGIVKQTVFIVEDMKLPPATKNRDNQNA